MTCTYFMQLMRYRWGEPEPMNGRWQLMTCGPATIPDGGTVGLMVMRRKECPERPPANQQPSAIIYAAKRQPGSQS
jgi:hypothetical protein